MFKLVFSEMVPLTRELAERLASMASVPGERPLYEGRVAFLRKRWDDGHFYPAVWATVSFNGVEYRVNGQHTSNMFKRMGAEFPLDMKVMLMRFAANDINDLPSLFAQFDARDSARSVYDIMNANGRIHGELDDVSATNIQRAISGIAWARGLTKRSEIEERSGLIHDEIPFILWANELIKARILQRASVIAAMYETWNRDMAEATRFWAWVRDQSHTDVNHPSRVLNRFLVESQINEARHPGQKRFNGVAFHHKCVHAWNAFRRGGRTNLKIYDNKTPPKAA